MGRYLKLLEESAENRLRAKCAVSPNPCAVSTPDGNETPDLPRLPRNRATAPLNYGKKKKDNDIKEE
jgi:hypothetical protein